MALLLACTAAGPVPVLDRAALPVAGAGAHAAYERFLLGDEPRAFALSPGGAFAWFEGGRSLDAVTARVLAQCRASGAEGCALYATNLQVVWPGRPRVAPPLPPGPLIAAPQYAFIPDPRFLWWGSAAARGVFVWAHGRGANGYDSRGEQPPPYVRAFNNAGFDVVRFDRDPKTDLANPAAQWLRQGLAALRRRGWRMVIAGGQSRGSWNALQILDTPGLADAVIAVSPAAFGTAPARTDTLGQSVLRDIFVADRSPQTRVAFIQFAADPFAGNEDERIASLNADLRPRAGAVLVIDRPPGLSGHGGANGMQFATRFGGCLLRFATETPAPGNCD